MDVNDSKSITCLRKHNFDLSKKGYVNLLLRSPKTDYNKNMFTSRSIICKSGFFLPMIEQISNLIINEAHPVSNSFKILDAGCGEGSHLAQVVNNLHERTSMNIQGVGIDISKDGIQLASRYYSNIIWCVADLTKIPFTDKQFNVVLSILSPSNYTEFNRIIDDEGLIIKVIPGSGYLKELRSIFYDHTDKQAYSNKEVINHFSNNFNIIDKHKIRYNVTVNKENLIHLIKMTPLSWGATSEKITDALNNGLKSITVDFTIILGKMIGKN